MKRPWAFRVAMILALAVSGCAAHHELRSAGSATAAPAAAGSAVLARRCAGCHATPDPAAMTGDKWLAALERMKRRMELPASEWESLAAMTRDSSAATPR